MNATLRNIARLCRVISSSLFTTVGGLNYDRVTDATIKLANMVHTFEGDTDELWAIGECSGCSLPDFIVGAYWHYTEWHGGQWSKEYLALSALGQVFQPGMTGPEEDNEVYKSLATMANS